ncbi:putative lipoprotein, partial [Leptospira interrogans serovar Djasiman str. LT1649]
DVRTNQFLDKQIVRTLYSASPSLIFSCHFYKWLIPKLEQVLAV